MRSGFTIHHNGPPANCVGQPHSRCLRFWDAVRAFHTTPEPIGKGWSDIAYSFGVCPHGERLVGRGWDRNQWANGEDVVGLEDGPDRDWYTVLVFVGGDTSTGDTEPPTREMVVATAALIEEGRDTGRCGMRVLPHSAFKRKPCPGPHFTALANRWDGQPITIDPPAPAPDLPEETDMFTYTTDGKATFFCSGGRSAGLDGQNDLATIRTATAAVDVPLPHFHLDAKTYEAFRKSFPGS